MTEELKIILKAITTDAKKNLEAVKKELNGIKTSGEKTGKSLGDSMKSIAKASAIVVGAITAVVVAMAKLGKSSAEIQKNFGKLISAFEAAGSSANQAKTTYKDLYRFMGDADSATEAAQQLAKITTNEQDLVEWTKSLQGVFATFGASLPIESLAESANETIKVGKVVGTMADALNWAGVSEDAFNASLANTNSEAEREALVRQTLNGLYSGAAALYERNNKAMIAYNESQARIDSAMAEMSSYLVPLITQFNNLGAAVLTVLSPAFETVSAILMVFVQWIIAAIEAIGQFFGIVGAVSGATSSYSDGMKSYYADLNKYFEQSNDKMKENEKNIEKAKKQLMGFDELNVVASGDTKRGDDKEDKMPKFTDYVDLSEATGLDDFQKKVDEIREKMKGLLMLVGSIAAGLAAWKIGTLINDIILLNTPGKNLVKIMGKKKAYKALSAAEERMNVFNGTTKIFIGKMMALGGAITFALGYMDAWANGIDWGNLAALIAGAAAVIVGLYLAFGKLAAIIGAAVAAVGLFVIGIKDIIENGPTLQNTILILGGAIATAVALATGGQSLLKSAIIAAVAAVAAFTAGILLEKSAIMDTKEAEDALTKAKEAAINAENNYISAVDSAEAALNRLKVAEEAAGMTGAELYKQVQDGTLKYADMTAEQKELYKAYLNNEQKQEDLKNSTENLDEAKTAEKIASWENQLALAKESDSYDEYKKSVVAAFEASELTADEARMLIEKSMSEMSTASQKTFMEDLPADIKEGMDPNRYETTGKKIKDWFSDTWESVKTTVKTKWNELGDWFGEKKDEIKDWFKEKWDRVVEWFNEKVKPKFTVEFWKEKFKAIPDAIKSAVNDFLEFIETGVNNIIKKLNKLSWTMPDWLGGYTFGFDLDTIQIPRLATGGIVTSSILANIGEAGKEAVLPLENNTEWMDTLADRIAERSNTPSKIVLTLDGKELGYATIGSINNITRQTGALQLVMA